MATALKTNSRNSNKGKAQKPRPSRRRYQPDVESMDSLCLLNAAFPAPDSTLDSSSIYVPQPTWSAATVGLETDAVERESTTPLIDAWDAAIAERANAASSKDIALADAYSESLSQMGYGRMERYLNRAWQKAGIEPPQDEDCTQSVYMVLLERWGRDQFEGLASSVGRDGLSTLVSRDTPMGQDFLRALDQIKKQTQRQMSRLTVSINESSNSTPDRNSISPDEVAIGRDLESIIANSLEPREAELIRSTIDGDSPSDIAARWGVTPKTVSNVKSEAISKLRVTLADRLDIDFRGQ